MQNVLNIMDSISPAQIKTEVKKFWDSFTSKSKNGFQELYSPTATVFSADGRRSEPGRLMWVRREREFFGPKSSVGAKVGEIVVQILSSNLAVAAYPFHFSVIRALPNGSRVQVEVPFGRATQVFQRDENGACRIIHEHLSSAEPVSPKELPADSASTDAR
ncbi:MAG: nuclear transport factor 2 family protein [Candidatus Angelobacter sp.]